MLYRLGIFAIGALLALLAAGCVPSSSASSSEVIDPRPVALHLDELPVGFVTRGGRYMSGRAYESRFQLADRRTQEDSGGLSEVWLQVESQPALLDAQNAITIFRDEQAAELLVTDFIRARDPSSGGIQIEEETLEVAGADEVEAYLGKWQDVNGYWAVYSTRFRVGEMTAWLQTVTQTNEDGDVVSEAEPTTVALLEVQARKMKDAQED